MQDSIDYLSPKFKEGFATECFKQGLDVETSTLALRECNFNAAMASEPFREGFNSELSKSGAHEMVKDAWFGKAFQGIKGVFQNKGLVDMMAGGIGSAVQHGISAPIKLLQAGFKAPKFVGKQLRAGKHGKAIGDFLDSKAFKNTKLGLGVAGGTLALPYAWETGKAAIDDFKHAEGEDTITGSIRNTIADFIGTERRGGTEYAPSSYNMPGEGERADEAAIGNANRHTAAMNAERANINQQMQAIIDQTPYDELAPSARKKYDELRNTSLSITSDLDNRNRSAIRAQELSDTEGARLRDEAARLRDKQRRQRSTSSRALTFWRDSPEEIADRANRAGTHASTINRNARVQREAQRFADTGATQVTPAMNRNRSKAPRGASIWDQ